MLQKVYRQSAGKEAKACACTSTLRQRSGKYIALVRVIIRGRHRWLKCAAEKCNTDKKSLRTACADADSVFSRISDLRSSIILFFVNFLLGFFASACIWNNVYLS